MNAVINAGFHPSLQTCCWCMQNLIQKFTIPDPMKERFSIFKKLILILLEKR